MKLITMKCTNCGADLEFAADRKQVFCSYCGTKLILDDGSVEVTNRIVDEARIKEAEVRLKELEYAHEREMREETLRQEQKKSFRLAIAAYAAALAAFYLIPSWREYFAVVLVFGAIALAVMKKGDRPGADKDGYTEDSPKSKLVALVLCIFLGFFGIHYFYVRKPAMGLVYLFTVGLFGVGWMIDIIRIACGTFRDGDGRVLAD